MLYIHATSWFCWAGKQQEQEESHLQTITVLSKHAAILELIVNLYCIRFEIAVWYSGVAVAQLRLLQC